MPRVEGRVNELLSSSLTRRGSRSPCHLFLDLNGYVAIVVALLYRRRNSQYKRVILV